MIENKDVLKALKVTGGWAWIGSSYDDLILHDKSKIKPTETEFNAKKKELEDEYEKNKYQRDRAVAYPEIVDQLDKIYHEGIDAWKAEIKKTKDAHPKPE